MAPKIWGDCAHVVLASESIWAKMQPPIWFSALKQTPAQGPLELIISGEDEINVPIALSAFRDKIFY